MCGIAGIINLSSERYPNLEKSLSVMNSLQRHRGPDGEGVWTHPEGHLGFAHCRLSIIDLDTGDQPMSDDAGNWIVFNGEIYNYIELREHLKGDYSFRTTSDTEVILAAYRKWGMECLDHLRGMFAFAIWDEGDQKVFCARDRFGIKPFYYTIINDVFYFASEIKALLPFLPDIETDKTALREYLTFQFTIGENTLFKGVKQLLPSHFIRIRNDDLKIIKYWEIYYNIDWENDEQYFVEKVDHLMRDSIKHHLRSDVPVGAYVSGGTDSSIVAALATDFTSKPFCAFTGKFSYGEGYDESRYAKELADQYEMRLFEKDISASDFADSIQKVIYHLDTPVAGPGSFPQYHVSKLAAQHRKVVLGGQGGDEIFGGYARYLLAYFEQCIKGAIDGTLNSGNFVVTYESIIPNLVTLKQYEPLMKRFWSKGMFEPLEDRYFQLVDRSTDLAEEINWDLLDSCSPYERFIKIFKAGNVGKQAYFDLMTHFDFKTLLPALLHVEDRMSMAHGLESRVPFLDHPLIEFVATVPADYKFKAGKLKRLLSKTFKNTIPKAISNRKDKMGFPVPLNEWMQDDLKSFVSDIFSSEKAKSRGFMNSDVILENLAGEGKFSRKTWGLLSLELWMREFHDQHSEYRKLLDN